MTDATPLDQAYAAMEAAPDDDRQRLGFYGRLVEGPLHLLLETEPEGDEVAPRVFELDEGRFVLAFDTEERLADFAAGPAPYAAFPGRRLVDLLAGQEIGIALNLGGAPSQMLLPAEAVEWLAALVAEAPRAAAEQIETLGPPNALPEAVVRAVDGALARAAGLAQAAYLTSVTYAGGRPGHLVAFLAPEAGAEAALARAVQQALVFSGADTGTLDVGFFPAEGPMAAPLAKWGLRFDLSVPEPSPPDPDRPPRLR